MKKYRFHIIAAVLLLAYVALTILRPAPAEWTLTLDRNDKNPYGTYILYERLGDLFSRARVTAVRQTLFEELAYRHDTLSTYVLIAPALPMEQEDVDALCHFVEEGNEAFISTYHLAPLLSDTLGLKISEPYTGLLEQDSLTVQLEDSVLAAGRSFGFQARTLKPWFSQLDSARTRILGSRSGGKANFVRVPFGSGFFYVHAAPLAFSNSFMLFHDNQRYTAATLSYLRADSRRVYWDDYYSLGPAYSGSILQFIMQQRYLRWAWRIALLAMVLYLLFGSKRRQRPIPVIGAEPNATLDFVRTVGQLYFNRQNNKNISEKKITYFLEYVRSRLSLPTQHLNAEFVRNLSRKSGAAEEDVRELLALINEVRVEPYPDNNMVMRLHSQINAFYQKTRL